jgi:hypothetical protein
MFAIIYDFKALSANLRKPRIDDWWQPRKPEPEAQVAKLSTEQIEARHLGLEALVEPGSTSSQRPLNRFLELRRGRR